MYMIPIFPLEIVVFPKEKLHLQIFEPRYKQLIIDCRDDPGLIFGIPYYSPGHNIRYGTLMRLTEISHTYPNGNMDIKTIGLRPFELKRLVKTMPDKLYSGGYIVETYWEEEGDNFLRLKILSHINDLYQLMNIEKIPTEFYGSFISFEVAHKVGLSKEQEYQLLQMISEEERQRFIIDHLERMIPTVKNAEEMRRKVQLNGHFKNIQPPIF